MLQDDQDKGFTYAVVNCVAHHAGSDSLKKKAIFGHQDSKKVKKRASWSLSRSKKRAAMQDDQDEGFIRAGQSRSEDGSPRTTLDDAAELDETGAVGNVT